MVEIPETMDDLVYFTKRTLGDTGKITVWVYRQKCTECDKALMGKPKNEKTGRAKIRATEYVCPKCNHTVEKQEYEDTLEAQAIYTCPACQHEGEGVIPYKRKKTKGVDALKFECEKCKEIILCTKKMKEPKEKKK